MVINYILKVLFYIILVTSERHVPRLFLCPWLATNSVKPKEIPLAKMFELQSPEQEHHSATKPKSCPES